MTPFVNTFMRRVATGRLCRGRARPGCFGKAMLVFVAAGCSAGAASSAGKIEYNRDVRPILSENCFPCHGTDSAARKAGLRLDQFDNATDPREGGHAAIVPGKPAKSAMLVRRIFDEGPDDKHAADENAQDVDSRSKRRC